MTHDLFDAYATYYCETESNPEIRCPDVIECFLRIFGYKRGQPFFGKQGDIIAARYQPKGFDWCDGLDAPDDTPFWVEQGRRNENMAWILVVFLALFLAGAGLYAWSFFTQQSGQQYTQAPTQLQYPSSQGQFAPELYQAPQYQAPQYEVPQYQYGAPQYGTPHYESH